MEEVSMETTPHASLMESLSSANKRKRKNPSPEKIETDEDIQCTNMPTDDTGLIMACEDVDDSVEGEEEEDEEEEDDDSVLSESDSQDVTCTVTTPPKTTPPQATPHFVTTPHSPAVPQSPSTPRPLFVTQPTTPTHSSTSPQPRIVMKFSIPPQLQPGTLTSPAGSAYFAKRGPGRPPGSGSGRPRGRPKGSTNSGERKSPGRPRIHPPKENQSKRPRGRPRIHPPKDPSEKKPRGRPISNPKYLEVLTENQGLQKRIQHLEQELGEMEDENRMLRKQLTELGVDTASMTKYRSYNKETEDLRPKRRFAYMNDDGTIRDFNGLDPARLKKSSDNHVEVVQPQDPDDAHQRCFNQNEFDNYMHDYDNGDEQTNTSFSPKDFKLRVVLQSPSPVKRPSPSVTPGEVDGEAPVKRGRGRPRIHFRDPNTPKRRPGRPPRVLPPGTPPKASPGTPKKRGRPPKSSYIPRSPGSALTTPVKALTTPVKALPDGVVGTATVSPVTTSPGPLTTQTTNGNHTNVCENNITNVCENNHTNVCENNGVSDLQETATEV